MSDNYGVPLRYFNLLGKGELRSGRIIVAFIAATVVLSAVIWSLVNQNLELQRTNVELQAQRVMYGFPNSEGVFISESQIPDKHIIAFTSVFLDNFFNFTPESSFANANEALRLMSPRMRALQEDGLKNTAKQSEDQQITQVFVRTTKYQIEYDKAVGYVVSFKASRYRATLSTVFDRRKYNIKILIKPVKVSKHFEWAVVADDMQQQEIIQ
ncbi:hypothetical protein ABH908_000291 [Pseudomonas frederiksbergensis]|uniref:hypothetical protein n=1 Tax=Pseudomonas TaxID=286 RepID=UPI003D204AEF